MELPFPEWPEGGAAVTGRGRGVSRRLPSPALAAFKTFYLTSVSPRGRQDRAASRESAFTPVLQRRTPWLREQEVLFQGVNQHLRFPLVLLPGILSCISQV